MIGFKTKKPIYKELALYLNVSEQTIKQYPSNKRHLMILGLWYKKESIYLSSNQFIKSHFVHR